MTFGFLSLVVLGLTATSPLNSKDAVVCGRPHFHRVPDLSTGKLIEKDICYQFCQRVDAKGKIQETDEPCERQRPPMFEGPHPWK